MSTFTTGSGDAVAARSRTNAVGFLNWLTTNNVKGSVTEYGWPGSSNPGTDPIPGSGTGAHFDPRWDAVAQQIYLDYNAAGLILTNWTASEWNVDLRSYRTSDGNNRPFNYRSTVTSVLEQNYTAVAGVLRGVNLAGGDFSDAGPNGALNLSKYTQPNAGYYYPSVGDWAVLYARGVRLVRLPFRWERVQTVLKGPLNHDIDVFVAAVTAAGAAGVQVLVDVHNYGRYDTAANGNTGYSTTGVLDVGQNAPAAVGGTMISCLVDFWSKMATRLKGNAGLHSYGIMNEPHDLTGGVATWQDACRQSVEAIRLIDQTSRIGVPGYFYDTVSGWVSQNGSTPWLTEIIPAGQTGANGTATRNTDPLIYFEGHHYWDNDGSGGYAQTYDQEVSNATNSGYTSYTNAGYVAPATNNTLQTGSRIVFTSSLDAAGDFSGTYDSIVVGTNTVTLPYSALGNPGNSMQVITSASSDTGGVRKSLTGSAFRIFSVDFYVPVTGTITGSGAITHFWRDDNATDLVELRFQSTGAGYNFGLTIPSGAYTFVNTGATFLAQGVWNTAQVIVTDTAINVYVNGSTVTEATITGSYAGVNIGGFFTGKYYATNYTGTYYFDNISCGSNATYYAPPNGGFLASVVTVVNSLGLIGAIE